MEIHKLLEAVSYYEVFVFSFCDYRGQSAAMSRCMTGRRWKLSTELVQTSRVCVGGGGGTRE